MKAFERRGEKKRGWMWLPIFCIAYLLLAARPTAMELVPVALSAAPMPDSESGGSPVSADAAASGLPFVLGRRFGYSGPDGNVLVVRETGGALAIDATAWAEYGPDGAGFTAKSPEGTALFECRIPGYPYFSSGRRFVLRPDQMGVTELDREGGAAWNREFPSVVTACAINRQVAIFGLMDGTIVGFDKAGSEMFRKSPGGSRLACIYGLAVSGDGDRIAAVSGLDPQKLSIYERQGRDYALSSGEVIPKESVHPVTLGFSSSGQGVLLSTDGGIFHHDSSTDEPTALSGGRLEAIASEDSRFPSIFFALETDGVNRYLESTGAKGIRFFRNRLATAEADIAARDGMLTIATGRGLYRLGMELR